MTDVPGRSRTVVWEDPLASAQVTRGMSGLQAMRAIADGTVPGAPIAALMRMRPVSVEEGTVVFACEPDESHYNPTGIVHGGLVCTLLDSVVGYAVHTTLPLGVGYTSLEIKVSYLAPVHTHSGPLLATGRVVKPGKRVAFAEGEVRDAAGKVVAGWSSCAVPRRGRAGRRCVARWRSTHPRWRRCARYGRARRRCPALLLRWSLLPRRGGGCR